MEREILFIIYNGVEYTLKEFHERGYEPDFWKVYRQIVNNEIEDDATYTVRYKNEDLTIRQMLDREDVLTSHLGFPKGIASLQISSFPIAWVCAHDQQIGNDFPEFYEVLRLFDVLNNRICSARYALLEGIYILHESAVMWWVNGSMAQLWLRTEFLNNAIQWYNNSFDVLLQTLWIGKKIYRSYGNMSVKGDLRTIQNGDEYDDILTRCKWDRIKKWYNKNDYAGSCFKSLCAFRNLKDFLQVKQWANKMKHRNGIFYEETYVGRGWYGTVSDYNPAKLTPELLSMDNVIDTLVQYHVNMLNLIEQVRTDLNVNKLDGKKN